MDFDYSEELELIDNKEHAMEECEVGINKEPDAAKGSSETSEIDSIRTVSSHFYNCPLR